MQSQPTSLTTQPLAYLAPALVWMLAWGAMLVAQNNISLGYLALILVLANAAASLWLRPLALILISSIAVGLFNWVFVPPRFTLTLGLSEDKHPCQTAQDHRDTDQAALNHVEQPTLGCMSICLGFLLIHMQKAGKMLDHQNHDQADNQPLTK
jgi:hypothetical protein